jgi:signal transduction histidine kinase/sensor domain CHASE-containing protein/ActR/RegA family two-component response regulator
MSDPYTRTYRHRQQPVLLGILLLYLLMCGTIASVLYLAANNANEQAIAESMREVKGYLQERRNNLESQIIIYAYWEDGIDNLTGTVNTQWADVEMGQYPLFDDFGIDLWFVLDPSASPTFAKQSTAYIDPTDLPIEARTLQQVLKGARTEIGPPPRADSNYIMVHDRLYLIAASALIIESRLYTVDNTWVLAFGRPLVGGVFQDIAINQGIELRLADTASTSPETLSLPLKSPGGEAMAWVEWEVDLAGNLFLAYIGPWVALVFGFALILCIFLLLRVARIYNDLSRSDSRFRDAIEALPHGFVIYDPDDRLQVCNSRYRELYSISAPAIVRGNTFEQIERYGFEHGQYQAGTDEEAAKSNNQRFTERLARHRQLSGTFEQHLHNNTWVRVVERGTSNGGVVSFRLDISELKLHEQELLAAKQRAEEANEAKSRFLATASHEVRTPLNAMLGFLGLLSESPLNETARNQVKVALRSGEHLLAIIENLMDFSRMDAGKYELEIHRFSPLNLVTSVGQMLESMAAERGLQLEVAHHSLCPDLMGDEGRLRQVLLNLVGNAVKFTEHGKVKLEVLGTQPDPTHCHLLFSIEDSGIGLYPEQMNDIFEPLAQMHTPLRHALGGVGLGLPISQKILQAMNSHLEVTSEAGHGSRFFFKLILELPEADAEVAAATEPLAIDNATIQPPQHAVKVLIADDVLTNRLLLQAMLKNSHYEVGFATNGCEAVAAVRSGHYDIVLMDILMPEMDGLEATTAIRKDPQIDRTPIIALTASAMKGDRERFLAAGMNDYLSKPVRKAALLDILGRWAR